MTSTGGSGTPDSVDDGDTLVEPGPDKTDGSVDTIAVIAGEDEPPRSGLARRSRLPRLEPVLVTFSVPDVRPYLRLGRDRVAEHGPVFILAAAIAWFFATFGRLVILRHNHFGTFDYDLGIWDQGVWLLGHGQQLDTVRGLNISGFHATPGLYLFVPFYWLGAGPNFLDVSMVAAFSAGAAAIYQAGRHHLRNDWFAVVPALAYLFNFAGQWLMQETFHPEVMAVPFLLFAYVCALKGRWRWYAGLLFAALLWKEDIALAGMMLGVVLAIRGRRTLNGDRGPERTRRVGLMTVLACAAYFVFATQWLIPHFSSGSNFTESFFGDLGTSTPDIVRSIVTRPDLVTQHLANSHPWSYFQQLSAAFSYVAWLSPLALLIGFPQATVNLLTDQNFFWSLKVHYVVAPLLSISIASTEGLARFKNLSIRRFLVGALAVGVFFTAVSWGVGPYSPAYHAGNWPLQAAPTQGVYERAVRLPGPHDAVASLYLLAPHLTHRSDAYTFPNPWLASNWGINGENRPDPDVVNWILVDPTLLSASDRSVLESAVTDPARLLIPSDVTANPPDIAHLVEAVDPRDWTIAINEPNMLALHRVRN